MCLLKHLMSVLGSPSCWGRLCWEHHWDCWWRRSQRGRWEWENQLFASLHLLLRQFLPQASSHWLPMPCQSWGPAIRQACSAQCGWGKGKEKSWTGADSCFRQYQPISGRWSKVKLLSIRVHCSDVTIVNRGGGENMEMQTEEFDPPSPFHTTNITKCWIASDVNISKSLGEKPAQRGGGVKCNFQCVGEFSKPKISQIRRNLWAD